MTREDFEIAYRRALTRSDWVTALRIVDERIDYATDQYEFDYLKREFDACTENQPRKGLSFGWLALGRRRKVTE